MTWFSFVLIVMAIWFIGKIWGRIWEYLMCDLEDYIYDKLKAGFLRRTLQRIRKVIVVFWVAIPIGSIFYLIYKLGESR